MALLSQGGDGNIQLQKAKEDSKMAETIVKIENPCYNTDTKKLRFGDGHKKYSELLDYKNDFYGRNLCGYKDSCGLCVNHE